MIKSLAVLHLNYLFMKKSTSNVNPEKRISGGGFARTVAPGMLAGSLLFSAVGSTHAEAAREDPERPNIVIVYADDVGIGDISGYGFSDLIPTPEIDRLAAGGVMFTDAYCTASTCTPSRYSLLTGDYAFRNPRAEILTGDAPILMAPGSGTLPEVLRTAGYRTGIVGKWHLGLGDGNIDWNGEVKPGPLEVGFDSSFIIPATNDRVPTVWLDGHRVHNWSEDDDPIRVNYNQRVGNLPTGWSHPHLMKFDASGQHKGTIVNGVSRIGFMDGGQSAWWDDEDMGYEIARRSRAFIEENKDEPFFLFMSMHQNHDPRLPHPDFQGKSVTGVRGDHVVELDWVVGDLVEALEELNLRENTLIIFTSDNGPVFHDGYYQGAIQDAHGHPASGPYRGGKYTIYEGSTRVPTVVNWPARVEPGIVSNAMLSQVDLLASLAALVGAEVPPGAAMDSENHLEAWLGETMQARDRLVQQGLGLLALRKGDWKYIRGGEAPGWVDPRHNRYPNPLSTPMPPRNEPLLFNLADDPGETTDLVAEHPEKLEEMRAVLKEITERERPSS